MKQLTIIITLLIPVLIQASAIKCKEDGTQIEMNQCAYEDFQEADKALNTAYKNLRAKHKANKLYINNLKTSQRLWIKFRDTELALIFTCEDENKRICFGSMYPLLYNAAKAEITRQRTQTLQRYLSEENL
jgi:uncharacterized protein YecT (DUF1311 family)